MRTAALVVGCAAAGALLGLPAAWVWSKLADPAASSLVKQGLGCAEAELGHQTRVTLWYMVIGAVACVVAGLLIGWLARRTGTLTIVGTLVFSILAAATTAFAGRQLFNPSGAQRIECAFLNYTLQNNLTVGTTLAYLVWPITGLIGVGAAAFLWRESSNDHAAPPASSNLVAQPPPS